VQALNAPQSTQQAGGEPSSFTQLSFPELYEQALVGPLFQPWVDPLLGEVELRSGDRVLDIACGTGIVARFVKERLDAQGLVVGVDMYPQMLAVARRIAPIIDWRQGDVGALPLREGERFGDSAEICVCIAIRAAFATRSIRM
jgi:SAM-dependent methyltransferase